LARLDNFRFFELSWGKAAALVPAAAKGEECAMDDRVPPYRERSRQNPPPSRWAVPFPLLFFTSLMVAFFLHSPLGRVETILIEGNHLVTKREILDKIRLNKGASFFRWDAGRAEQILEDMPEIDDAQVDKSFPGKVRIRIRESRQVALWRQGDKLVPVLANGRILTKRPWEDGSPSVPVLSDWGANAEERSALARELGLLPRKRLKEIVEIRPGMDPVYRDVVRVHTRWGHEVRLRIKEFHKKMELYSEFRHHPPGTIYLIDSIRFVPERRGGE